MTAALEGVEWSTARPSHTLPPGKTRYPFYSRLGGLQGWSGRAENLVPTGIRSRTVQPVVSHYTDRATRPTTTTTTTILLLLLLIIIIIILNCNFIVFLTVQYLIIYYIPTNCTNLLFIYEQRIKTFVLFKLLKLLLHVSVTD